MAKSVELTENGKRELVEWALDYYDKQNEEPEAVDIVDVNIPVEQQQMDVVLKKLKKTIEIMDKKLGLTEGLKTENDIRDAKFYNTTIMTCVGSTVGLLGAGIVSLIDLNPLIMFGAGVGVVSSFVVTTIWSLISNMRLSKKDLKAKLDKKLIKNLKKHKISDMKFSEDEYTLLFLEKLYNELLVQNESVKNVLKVGV